MHRGICKACGAMFFESSKGARGEDLCDKCETRRDREAMSSGERALAIGEHAFRAGFVAGANCQGNWPGAIDQAWSEYDPPEDIKALS